MFGFLKKLFGFDQAATQPAQVPYKTEPPLLDKVEVVNARPIVKADTKPAAIKAAPKAAAAKKPAAKKPTTRQAPPKKKTVK